MTPQGMVQYMNELLTADPEAIQQLISQRVACNGLADHHPHVAVTEDLKIGLLGILNGFLLRSGDKRIAAHFDEDGVLEGFALLELA